MLKIAGRSQAGNDISFKSMKIIMMVSTITIKLKFLKKLVTYICTLAVYPM